MSGTPSSNKIEVLLGRQSRQLNKRQFAHNINSNFSNNEKETRKSQNAWCAKVESFLKEQQRHLEKQSSDRRDRSRSKSSSRNRSRSSLRSRSRSQYRSRSRTKSQSRPGSRSRTRSQSRPGSRLSRSMNTRTYADLDNVSSASSLGDFSRITPERIYADLDSISSNSSLHDDEFSRISSSSFSSMPTSEKKKHRQHSAPADNPPARGESIASDLRTKARIQRELADEIVLARVSLSKVRQSLAEEVKNAKESLRNRDHKRRSHRSPAVDGADASRSSRYDEELDKLLKPSNRERDPHRPPSYHSREISRRHSLRERRDSTKSSFDSRDHERRSHRSSVADETEFPKSSRYEKELDKLLRSSRYEQDEHVKRQYSVKEAEVSKTLSSEPVYFRRVQVDNFDEELSRPSVSSFSNDFKQNWRIPEPVTIDARLVSEVLHRRETLPEEIQFSRQSVLSEVLQRRETPVVETPFFPRPSVPSDILHMREAPPVETQFSRPPIPGEVLHMREAPPIETQFSRPPIPGEILQRRETPLEEMPCSRLPVPNYSMNCEEDLGNFQHFRREELPRLPDYNQSEENFRNTPEIQRSSNGEWIIDETVLRHRQKEIDVEKNTKEYHRYITTVPKSKRTALHPKTPDRELKCSNAEWENRLKEWCKRLCVYDPSGRDRSRRFL